MLYLDDFLYFSTIMLKYQIIINSLFSTYETIPIYFSSFNN